MKQKRKLTTCSRGHKFYKTAVRPVCPICLPGRYKKAEKNKHYHKDGSMYAKGSMLGGKMHGSWIWFRKDGTKMRTGSFKNGKQIRKWTTYDREGNVVKVTQMK
mgnify:CR=1 FL=1